MAASLNHFPGNTPFSPKVSATQRLILVEPDGLVCNEGPQIIGKGTLHRNTFRNPTKCLRW